jgi:hypothetical protein
LFSAIKYKNKKKLQTFDLNIFGFNDNWSIRLATRIFLIYRHAVQKVCHPCIRQRPRPDNIQSLINCINDALKNDVFNMDGYFNRMRQIIPSSLSNSDIT